MPKKSEAAFPLRLHYMLSELAKDGFDDIVGWRPHGRCFGVSKMNVFVKEILPSWFQQTKYASFQRQLNLYGFKRITRGRDKECYYHPLFLRSKMSLAAEIKKSPRVGNAKGRPSSPGPEPDFYQLPYMPEDSSSVISNIIQRQSSANSSLLHPGALNSSTLTARLNNNQRNDLLSSVHQSNFVNATIQLPIIIPQLVFLPINSQEIANASVARPRNAARYNGQQPEMYEGITRPSVIPSTSFLSPMHIVSTFNRA